MEEVFNILGATLLENPKSPFCNRRDARDKENLLGFLGVYGKAKDTPEARHDQQLMKDPGNLHPMKTDKGDRKSVV